MEPIATRVFRQFQRLVLEEAGISLTDAKRALLVGRLSRRLRELGLASYGDYLARVVEDDEERVRMLDAIATNETRFFREPRQLEFLRDEVFPRWAREGAEGARPRRVRVWSAGCATGEEAYSLAMLLLSVFGPGWDLGILATDLSTKALAKARAAVWPVERAAQIPEPYRKAYMLRGTGPEAGRMKAGPELRALVDFRRLNLAAERWETEGPFDVLLCRNVLIYFDADGKRLVIARLLDRLAPGGYFLVGHAESLNGLSDRVRPARPSVYAAVPAPAARDSRAERAPA
jgi:chemotaxis protein methyltransferase CheR